MWEKSKRRIFKRWTSREFLLWPPVLFLDTYVPWRVLWGNREAAVTAATGRDCTYSEELRRAWWGSELFQDTAHHVAHVRVMLFRHTPGRSRHKYKEVVWNYYICLLAILTLRGPPTSQDVFELLTKLSSGAEMKLQILFSQSARKISNFLNYYYYYYQGTF